MVMVTRDEFNSLVEQVKELNGKMDAVISLIGHIANEHDEDAKTLSDFRKETKKRFDTLDTKVDELNAKVDCLTEAHGELRGAFDRHYEDSQ